MAEVKAAGSTGIKRKDLNSLYDLSVRSLIRIAISCGYLRKAQDKQVRSEDRYLLMIGDPDPYKLGSKEDFIHSSLSKLQLFFG
ncbi:hypothetical protein [Pantoea ananatis]|uniref:hypothetical protein n=2 Tax=Erwiniaceae TaxID=1903409 RepID=UPI0015767284|nr:hypothetical protein [Pantoea ananatis]